MNWIAGRHPLAGWIIAAIALVLLPAVLSGDFAVTIATQAGIAIIFALSYNMLLGQGGMLSFGHAVYSGLGAYLTIHALAAINDGMLVFPITLLPLVGGAAGLGFAGLLGYATTGRAGTPFAMISLGVGELVAACIMMLPAFFGGEAGISADRVTSSGLFGIDYASQRQIYYLVAGWALVCAAAMYFVTRTPFGRLANAVRDNPQRVGFVGYDTHRIRFQMLLVSGFFAGISGGLAALNNEIVTVEAVGAHASGVVLLMVFIGGIGQFIGPVLGAILVTLLQTAVSHVTPAWQFYFGAIFLTMVLFAPGGLSSLVAAHAPLRAQRGSLRALLPSYLMGLLALLIVMTATVLGVESLYQFLTGADGTVVELFAVPIDSASPLTWLVIAAISMAGAAIGRRAITDGSLAWTALTEKARAGAIASARSAGPHE